MTEPRPTILVVEDEPEIRRFLRASLGAEGYRVVESTTGRRGIIDAGTHKPDLVIVDLGLPDLDGIDVVKRVREWSTVPILILSARLHERSKVEALDAGADDYITKPFGWRVARSRARCTAARRAITSGNQCPGISQRYRRSRTADGNESRTRYPADADRISLLTSLAKHLNMVVTHRQLLTAVWGPTHERDTHYLRIYMKQLREKLEVDPVRPRHLLTEIGVGYRLVLPE